MTIWKTAISPIRSTCPTVSSPRDTDCRLCVIHRNIPNMLCQISGVVSSGGLNIENMINKAKKDYAYTILDLQADGVAPAVVDQIPPSTA